MSYRVVLYSPDRAIEYDGRTPDATGVGGGITARISLVAALAALGHDVTAYVNCAAPTRHAGVQYLPLDDGQKIDGDVLIAISTGGELSFAPLRTVKVRAALRVLWVQGVPKPLDLEAVEPDWFCVASNFLRDVLVQRWGIEPHRIRVCYNGLKQDLFQRAAASGPSRDPFALVYVGPTEKGLSASLEILRRLRKEDGRYRLDVFGGDGLWGRPDASVPAEPGLELKGTVGQRTLIAELFRYEYCLAPQAIEEGFGIAVQEAKRAGAIVFASNVGAFRELFRTGSDGFLIPDPHTSDASHDFVARRILQLSREPARRSRIRRLAMQTPWSWDLAARTWTAWFDQASNQQQPGEVIGPGRASLIQLPDGLHSPTTGAYYPAVYPASPVLDELGGRNRVLIGGYYGHGNLGDEAILSVTLEAFRQQLPNFAATVVSGNPDLTRQVHDVEVVHERDITGLLDAAAGCDLILLGGGGLFQDYRGVDEATFLTSLHWGQTYFSAFPALATLTGKPFMLYAVGVGPLATALGQHYTRLTFERADAATVRDAASLALLRSIGVSTERITVTADPVFLLDAAPAEQVEQWLREAGVPVGHPLVAVAVREWDIGVDAERWQTAVAEALDRFVERHDAFLLFVPFQSRQADTLTDDLAVAERLQRLMRRGRESVIWRAAVDAHEVRGIFEQCALVLAMRLHAVVLAASARVPITALAYDPKVRAAMQQIGLGEYALELDALTADALFDRLDSALGARPALQPRLVGTLPEVERAAASNVVMAADLLRRRPFTAPGVSDAWSTRLREALLYQLRRAEAADARAGALAAGEEDQSRLIARLTDVLASTTQEMLRGLAAIEARRASEAAAAEAQAADAEAKAAASNSTVQDLARQLEVKNQEVWALSKELMTLQSGRAWRLLTTYRRARRSLGRLVRHPADTTPRVFGSLARSLVSPPARARIRARVGRRLMNPYAYVFDLYRRARSKIYGAHVGGLCGAGEPGLVSIVLPAHNGASMIGEAIESILAQRYHNFELIVVNDGSTDETGAMADEFARRDSRIRVVHQENRKLPGALSRGFRIARGEFLTWTSCDNRLKPAFVEHMVGCLRRHPAWDMAYANLDLIDDDGAYLRGSTEYESYQQPHQSEHIHLPRAPSDLNVWANNYVGAAFLYRDRVAALLGDYSRFRFVMEDYDYWMRVNALLTLRHADFDEPIYDYRFHGRSLTSRWTELRMLEHRERLMVFEDFRRDFYLSPMLWIIEGEHGPVNTALKQRLTDAGHVLYGGTYRLEALPRLWTPTVYVEITSSPDTARPSRTDLPPHTLTVLVTAAATLPTSVSGAWDLCCAVGAPASRPRLGGPYQGWLAALDEATLFHAIDIRAKSQHLGLIEAAAESPAPPALKASVVICTHRFNERVVQAIRSALQQDPAHEAYEVVVVNNNPGSQELDKAVARLREEHVADRPDRLRLVVCPVPGLSAARNAGIAESRGQYLCFLDDDAVAGEQWLARICSAFDEHPDAGVIGGHIHLKVPEPRPRALRPGWEKYWSQFVTGFSGYTEVRHWWEFPWGANWAARRAALVQAGGFRSRYGRTGDNFWGGEELVAAGLIQRLGYKIAVQPDAAVSHDVDRARFTFPHVLRTLIAGHQVAYLAERDLYIPKESSLGTTLRQILTQHFDRSVPSGDGRWRNAFYRKYAQTRLLVSQLRDLRRRMRTAVVAADPEGA